jgi:AraC-like DNA-binding protein
VRRALDYIEANLSVAGLTAESIAQDQRISRRRLDQLMHEICGHSIASHLWSRRLEQAAADLRDPVKIGLSVAQIAFANGFEDAAHFTRAFKKRFGSTPGQWRLN